MAAGMYPYADGSGWPTDQSWLIRPEKPSAGYMSPALWSIRQMQAWFPAIHHAKHTCSALFAAVNGLSSSLAFLEPAVVRADIQPDGAARVRHRRGQYLPADAAAGHCRRRRRHLAQR